MINHHSITEYSADKQKYTENMFYDLWNSRELVLCFFLREISGKYRQSFLGYIWAIIPALTTVFAASYIKNNNIINIGNTDEISYPVYVITGITCWQLFSIGLTRTTQCLANSQAIITKINFCRETLVFAAFGESVFEFLIRIPLIAVIYVWYGICPTWQALYIPVVLFFLSLFTIGLGFFLTLINGVFRDLANSLSLLLTFGMLLTPALFSPSVSKLNYINPISTFVISIKSLAFDGTISNPKSLTFLCIISIIIFLTGWRFFRIAIPRIAERV